jgi:hypothetical protein
MRLVHHPRDDEPVAEVEDEDMSRIEQMAWSWL